MVCSKLYVGQENCQGLELKQVTFDGFIVLFLFCDVYYMSKYTFITLGLVICN